MSDAVRAARDAARLRQMLERVNLRYPLGPGFHAELLHIARGLEQHLTQCAPCATVHQQTGD